MFRTLFLGALLYAGALFAAPGDILQSYPSPHNSPSGMAFDGQNLWVADFKSDSLYALNPTDGSMNRALLSPTERPYGLAWDGSNLWIVDAENNDLICINPYSGEVVTKIPSPVDKPTGLAWDGEYLWLADQTSINKVSPNTGTRISSFRAPAGSTTGLTFDNGYLWAADRIRDRIYMISPASGDVIIVLDSPGPYPWGLAVANGLLYNVDYQTDRVYEMVLDDGAHRAEFNPIRENMNYSHEIRNSGPGVINSLDVYLAIPQNSERQKLETEPIFISDAAPSYVTDVWGQPYAAFHFDNIPPGQRITVSYMVTANLFESRYYVFPEKVETRIPKDIKNRFLADDPVFDMHNPVIKNALEMAVGSETNPYWKARKIYNWIIANMSYELAGGWNSAPEVIKRGSGSCSEYSYVFIAMCRAAGIPARYTGAITLRGDRAYEDKIFHRWAEIYLAPYGWIPVDPSGGDSPSPENRAMMFGAVGNNYLITTTGSGSEYIGWGYNSDATWSSTSAVKVKSDSVGEWSPADEATAITEASVPGGQFCRPSTSEQ